MRRFMVGKERFLFKSFLGLAEKQLFFRKMPLDFTMVTFSLNPSFSDPPPPSNVDLPSYIQLFGLHLNLPLGRLLIFL